MWLEKIKHLHIETSSLCNARCPLCGRNPNSILHKNLYLESLNPEHIKFVIQQMPDLERITLCGNYGDPLANPNILEIIKILNNFKKDITINIHTNGSLKTKEFYKELALNLNQKSSVNFGIDGLKDTNHLYRVNTNFEKILENANEFIKNGGYAKWTFIVFKHNENQIEEAKELSKKLNFKEFIVKKTKRIEEKVPVYINDKINHYIENPSENINFNLNVNKEFSCRSKYYNELYLDAKGFLYPCCWTGLSLTNNFNVYYDNDTSKYTIKEILSGEFFTFISENFKNKLFEPCNNICGEKKFEKQFI